jgi:dimethylargininase
MLIAITRAVSPSIVQCELTHLAREPIDVARATAQHEAGERALEALGCVVVRAPAAPEQPDAVFIEDTAIVLDELAVMTRPGAQSRRAETIAVAEVLAAYRPLHTLSKPATLDGGDVLRIDRTLYVGRSGRTNEAGIEQLRNIVAPFEYEVVAVRFSGCLHLKSAVTAIAEQTLLINPAWVSPEAFPGCDVVRIDEREPYAANALRVADAVLYPTEYPRTRDRIAARGMRVETTDCSELAKAEGAVTCCSLVFEARV